MAQPGACGRSRGRRRVRTPFRQDVRSTTAARGASTSAPRWYRPSNPLRDTARAAPVRAIESTRSSPMSDRRATTPLLAVEGLTKHFAQGGGLLSRQKMVRAVDGVSFQLHEGETLGLVGESGCGKSTVARTLMCLTPATGGSVRYRGEEILALDRRRLRELRRDIQFVFQDPYSSLSPRMTV